MECNLVAHMHGGGWSKPCNKYMVNNGHWCTQFRKIMEDIVVANGCQILPKIKRTLFHVVSKNADF